MPPGDSQINTTLQVNPAVTGLGGSVGLAPTDPSLDRINWAASSKGAKLTLTNAGPLRGSVNALIDELSNPDPNVHWVGGRWNIATPGTYLLDLGQQRTIDTLLFHVWDGDDRYARYKVEGSLDNRTFFSLADKSIGEQRGLQRITFQPTEIRYVRITGLFDSHETSFYLYDEIMAIGDAVGTPMAGQTMILNSVNNAGTSFTVGKKIRLNAGIYEITRQSGAVSWYVNDTDKAGFVPDVLGDNVLVKVLPALRYQEISDLVQVTSSAQKTTMNRKTRMLNSTATLNVTNQSTLDIKTPIRLVFELSHPNVIITGVKVDENGLVYLEVANQLLKPGETAALNVQFSYTVGSSFTYKTKVFGGVVR